MYRPDKFTNNARATLALAASAEDTAIHVSFVGGDRFYLHDVGEDSHKQRLTITHPSRPDEYEIVALIGRTAQNVFTVVRGIEGTTPAAWLQGSAVEARVTAGMLADFAERETPMGQVLRDVGHTHGYGATPSFASLSKTLIPGRTRGSLIGQSLKGVPWPAMGAPIVGRTEVINVSGSAPLWNVATYGVKDGQVISLAGFPNIQFLVEVQSNGKLPPNTIVYPGEAIYDIPEHWADPAMTNSLENHLDMPDPFHIELPPVDGGGEVYDLYLHPKSRTRPLVRAELPCLMVPLEVGFIGAGGGPGASPTYPRITVGAGRGADSSLTSSLYNLLVDVEMAGVRTNSFFRAPIDISGKELPKELHFRVTTHGNGNQVGFFYWVGIPALHEVVML